MKTIVIKKSKVVDERTEKARNPQKSENLFLFLAIVFMGAGFFAPLLGMVLAVVHSIVAADILFSRISTILFVISIPLLFAGSHFMDVERARRKMRKRKDFERKIKD